MTNYERVLRVVIFINGLLGLALLICPSFLVSGLEHGAGASTWARGAGLFLSLLSIALLPPAVIALANRYLAVFAAVAQVLSACSSPFPALVWPGCWQSTSLSPRTYCSQLCGAGSGST